MPPVRINTDRIKLEVKRSRRPFMTLLALLACGTVASWVIFKNQLVQWPWQSYYEARLAVQDAKGLVPGEQEVRIAGVRVGVIKSVDLVGGHAVVTISIAQRYAPLYRDALIRIRPVTPLQDMYIAIASRGHPGAGKLSSGQILPVDQTTALVDISRVLNTFDPGVRAHLTVLLKEMDRGLSDNGARLNAAFVSLAPFLHAAQRLTQVMADRHAELADLVHNFAGLTAALATRDREITSLVSVGDQTLSSLAAADQPLAGTLAGLPPTLSTLDSSFASVRAAEGHLDPALTALHPAADALNPGLAALQRFAADATPALSALQPSVRSLRPLARDLAPTAGSLSSAFRSLAPQAPRLDRITQKVSRCESIIGHFFNWTLSVLKFGETDGALPRGEATVGLDSAGGGSPTLARHPGCAS